MLAHSLKDLEAGPAITAEDFQQIVCFLNRKQAKALEVYATERRLLLKLGHRKQLLERVNEVHSCVGNFSVSSALVRYITDTGSVTGRTIKDLQRKDRK